MDVFDLCASLSLDKSQYDKGLGEAEKSGSSIGSRIGAGFAKVGKAVTVGIGAASTAVGALASMSVKGYSDYEQLAGGVETLFKKSSQSVISNASKAYQTAGMSANEYMETVTGFSASLLQSLGGDTQKAAEKADTAIRDMSDNANKMGTDIGSIQNAYQGFAKQNYTMLDNLKLGYGGTKEEMGRLLKDAEKISGVKYDISSYADIVDAIHVVQTEMGITGTTAKEASTTIQGSLKSAKSAWQDLLTGLSDDNANIDKLVNNFFDSVVTVGENIIPRIGVVLNGITGMIEKLAPKIMAKLPSIFKQILPSVVKGVTSLLTAFTSILPELSKTITKLLPDFIKAIASIFKGIVNALPGLVKTIAKALPTLIPQITTTITNMVVYLMKHTGEILQPIIDNLPVILKSIISSLLENLPVLIDGLIEMNMQLVQATPQIIMAILEALPDIIQMIIDKLLGDCLPQLIEGLIQLTTEIVAHTPEIIAGLIQAIPKVVSSIVEGLFSAAPKIWGAFGQIFSKALEGIKNVFKGIGDFFKNIFQGAWEGIKTAWSAVGSFFSGIWENIKKPFVAVKDFFVNAFRGAYNGIKTIFQNIGNWFKGIFNGIVAVIKAPINLIIKGLNALIGGLNTISFDIPDWVPLLGGKHFGFDIPEIPQLAKGGVVKGGTPFIAGEAGAEAVIPLENNNQWIYKFAHAFADGLSTFYDGNNFTQTPNKGTGGKVVNINLYLDNVNVKNDDDIEDVANKVSERIAEKLVAEGMAVG